MNTKTTFTKILLLFGILMLTMGTHAQVKMGSNPQTIGASSLLELESTSKALVIPRMTTAQLSAISTPVAGMLVYNTDSNCIAQRTSSAWKYLCTTGGNASPLNWSVTGNSGTNSGSNFLGTTNNTSLKIKTNNIDRMIIDSTGKIGIGTVTPTRALHLVNTGSNGAGGGIRLERYVTSSAGDEVECRKARGTILSPTVVVDEDEQGGIETFGYDGSSFIFGTAIRGIVDGTPAANSMPSAIAFYINPGNTGVTERMRIISSGYVGIGTSTPGGLLELGADQGRKPSTNTWTIPSDERLKTIEGSYTKGLAEVMQLSPILYHYKNTDKRTFDERVLQIQNVGYSAQAIQKIFPEAVGLDADGYMNFNIHPLLVAYGNAIKELKIIQDQQNSILALEESQHKDSSSIKNLTQAIQDLRKENRDLKDKLFSFETSLSALLKRLENIETIAQMTEKK